MKKIELLAPAKNLELGKLAILCGADAVYIGAEKFGARAKVGNSIEDIAELTKFASQYYAKVYVTINTLLFDDEIEKVVKLIDQLYKIGVDGIIIQDMGLLEYNLPPIPIIASTQCFCNTPEKAEFFQQLGFKRIILPRELNLKQIQQIRDKAKNIELEFFIHGALCVSYSGQCYMSYALGNRSGNRGVCAQPCRKLYSITDANGRMIAENQHMLSLKDMNQSDHLEELLTAGVTSFKIEGRLKDDAYIKNVVTYYRYKIDEILAMKNSQKSSSGKTNFDFAPNPDKTFNRGYTDHFITGKQINIASTKTPKMKGEFLGKIKLVKPTFFILENEINLANGDGICFFVNDKLRGTNINNTVGKKIYADSLKNLEVGMEVYRNYDHEFLKKLKQAKINRKIEMDIIFSEVENGYQLSAIDEDNNQSEYFYGIEKVYADNSEMAKANLKKNLQKTGNTIFHCNKVKFQLEKMPYLKKSQINEIRRELLNNLLEERIKNKPLLKGKMISSDIKYVTEELDFRGNVINEKAKEFYQRHGVQKIEWGAETGMDMTEEIVMTTKYCIREELGKCLKKIKHSGDSDWNMTDEKGNCFQLKFRCDVCEMDVIKE